VLAFDWPQWQTIHLAAAMPVIAALLATLRFRLGMGRTLLGNALPVLRVLRCV
jgi:hypothetical protein